jgi:hypothetical protein
MAAAVNEVRPVAHLSLILGMLRKLDVAIPIDSMLPRHSGNVLSVGRGVEASVLAILDGQHALYKVGAKLEERGMLPLLQGGLKRESLNDYRLGQILDALFAANLKRGFSVLALKLDFCPFEPLTSMRGLGNQIVSGAMGANTPGR